jgi:branched-chain amino acid transport system permease protein
VRIGLSAAPSIDGSGRPPFIMAAMLLGLCLFSLVLAIHLASDGRYDTMVATIGISAITAIGYQIFVGNTGIISFGHPAFLAIGAYAAGILTMPLALKTLLLPDLPHWLAVIELGPLAATVTGGVLALAAGLLVGPVVLRLSGATAGIMTFGLLIITYDVVRNATSITKGNQTFFGVPRSMDSPAIFAILTIAIMVAVIFKFSSPGLRARAVREDPLAAAAAGIDAVHARLGAWALSAFISGVAGALIAQNLTAFSANSFYVSLVIPTLLMVVLGGMGSVAGAVLGTIMISGWLQIMRVIEGAPMPFGDFILPAGLSDLTLGIGLLALLRMRPDGLLSNLELVVPLRRWLRAPDHGND